MSDKTPAYKEVLCCFKEHKRTVQFHSGLKEAIKKKFGDILPSNSSFFYQMKHEEWKGEFVDVLDEADVVNDSILRIVVETTGESSKVH